MTEATMGVLSLLGSQNNGCGARTTWERGQAGYKRESRLSGRRGKAAMAIPISHHPRLVRVEVPNPRDESPRLIIFITDAKGGSACIGCWAQGGVAPRQARLARAVPRSRGRCGDSTGWCHQRRRNPFCWTDCLDVEWRRGFCEGEGPDDTIRTTVVAMKTVISDWLPENFVQDRRVPGEGCGGSRGRRPLSTSGGMICTPYRALYTRSYVFPGLRRSARFRSGSIHREASISITTLLSRLREQPPTLVRRNRQQPR